jgi:hypothetical protein
VLVKTTVTGSLISMSFHYATSSHTCGFYRTLEEAQHQQLIERISGQHYEIYCLEVPVDKIKKD